MNAIWGYRLAPVFHLLRIPVLLWYAHGTVTDRLRRAHRYVTRVVTSTPEGFRLPSDKVSVIGQGVDASLFTIQEHVPGAADMLTVGRISPRKRIDLMIDVMDALIEVEPSIPFRLVVIGAPLTSQDQAYQKQLEQKAAQSKASNNIQFVGHVPITRLPAYYRTALLHLNLSLTGSMDKTVMEALAAGCPVLTSNEAFRETLSSFPNLLIKDDHPKAIAQQILGLHKKRETIDHEALRALVVGKHDLATYGIRILEELRRLKDVKKNR
jgi:glycosyltransferase involved in cell wall biosynthesis